MSTRTTDKGKGLGIALSLVSVAAAVATAALGYQYAIDHARAVQINGGIAFGVAVLAAGLAVAAVHVYEDR